MALQNVMVGYGRARAEKGKNATGLQHGWCVRFFKADETH